MSREGRIANWRYRRALRRFIRRAELQRSRLHISVPDSQMTIFAPNGAITLADAKRLLAEASGVRGE